jgi:hypothetical protein
LRDVRNPAWYRVRIARDGFLGFVLELSEQDQTTDDYDFAVYDATGGKTCDDLTLFDERSCNYADRRGNTGANGMGESSSQGSRGTNFNARIPVKRGEEYLILISNYAANPRSAGYRLNFSSSTLGIIDRSGGRTSTPNTASNLLSAIVPEGACQVRQCRVNFSTDIRCASVNDQTFVLQSSNNAALGDIPCRIVPSERCQKSPQNNYERSFSLQFAVPLTQSGTYSLRIQRPALDLCGNAVEGATTLTIRLNPEPLTLRVGGYDYLCNGASTYLFADIAQSPQSQQSSDSYRYEWSKNGSVLRGEVRNFLVTSELAEYRLFVEDTLTGCSQGASIRVRDGNDFKPRIQPSPSVNICANDSVRLDAGGDLEQIQWFFRGFPLGNERSRYLQVSSGGEYSVRAVRNGCEATSDAVRVNIQPIPSLSQASNFFTVNGNSVTCNVPAARYEWLLDGMTLDTTPAQTRTEQTRTGQTIVPPRSGKLSVRLFTEAGCSVSSTLAVPPIDFNRIAAEAEVRIPDTLKAPQNRLIKLPLLLESMNLAALRAAGVTGIRATLRMNARLLIPEDKRIMGDSVQNIGNDWQRTILINTDLPTQFSSNTASLLDTLTFRAMLGNTTSTMILLENLETMPLASMATLSAKHGAFTLTNVSTRATIRLITGATTMLLTLTTAPNPASEGFSMRILVQNNSLQNFPPIAWKLHDLYGREVLSHLTTITVNQGESCLLEERVNTITLSQGVYVLSVECGAERVNTRVEVVR